MFTKQNIGDYKMLNRESLLSGTRPEVGNRILMTAGEHFDGYQIIDYKGMVWGISVRTKDIGTDFIMGCKQLFGGELTSFTELADEGRQKAIDRMLDMARRLGVNALINFRFHNENVTGLTEVTAYATGVVIKPIIDYVPTGAIGNILAEIADNDSSTDKSQSLPKKQGMPQVGQQFPQQQTVIQKPKYPLATLKFIDNNVFAKCPECKMIYKTAMNKNNQLEVKGYEDADKYTEGQQIKCENCQTIFTVPNIDKE